jgi:excisionase family DNA binding protein
MAADPSLTLSLDEPLLDVEQAAALLAVRPSWVRDATRAGRLPCIRVGKHMQALSDLRHPALRDQRTLAHRRGCTRQRAIAAALVPGVPQFVGIFGG